MGGRRAASVGAAAMAVVAALTLAGCSNSATSTSAAGTTSAQSAPASSAPATSAASGSVTCQYPASGAAAKAVNVPPTTGVANTGTVAVTMTTGDGVIDMTFDRSGAPCAVNSFVSLAQQHYFDATTCHRLVPGFVLQCGDPTGTGMGGPGYSFPDELSGKETYPRGTVAMANAGPDTNGSQFFIVLANAQLPPSYDVLGTVSSASMSVVDAIATKDGDPSSQAGKPLNPIDVASITVS